MKVAFHEGTGRFHLSRAAMIRYAELKGITLYPEDDPWPGGGGITTTYWLISPSSPEREWLEANAPWSGDHWRRLTIEEQKVFYPRMRAAVLDDSQYFVRHEPELIQTIEELGVAANGDVGGGEIVIEELPDGSLYRVQSYEGDEWIETPGLIEWVQP